MAEPQTTARYRLLDRLAALLGIWALRRLYGADCDTNIRDDFPGEDVHCLGCDATKIVNHMREIVHG